MAAGFDIVRDAMDIYMCVYIYICKWMQEPDNKEPQLESIPLRATSVSTHKTAPLQIAPVHCQYMYMKNICTGAIFIESAECHLESTPLPNQIAQFKSFSSKHNIALVNTVLSNLTCTSPTQNNLSLKGKHL